MGFPGGTGGSPCKLGGLQVSSKAVFPAKLLGMLSLFPGGMGPKSPDLMGESYCRVIFPTRGLRFVRQLAGKADCRPEEARRICADQSQSADYLRHADGNPGREPSEARVVDIKHPVQDIKRWYAPIIHCKERNLCRARTPFSIPQHPLSHNP